MVIAYYYTMYSIQNNKFHKILGKMYFYILINYTSKVVTIKQTTFSTSVLIQFVKGLISKIVTFQRTM